MFLRATLERNPELLDAAIELHRIRAIGPNTLILDIDRIVEKRTAHLSEGARARCRTPRHDEATWARNPFMALAALHGGMAVDVPEARLLHLHGVPLGHVGHLVQISARDTDDVLAREYVEGSVGVETNPVAR